VANKKCPKCGEDNPAEAVMCWACYTPLTAGAGAAMSPGAGSGATALPRSSARPGAVQPDEKEKKKVDPRLFFVGGGLLVAGVIFAFTTGLFGGSGGGDVGAPPADPTGPTNGPSSGTPTRPMSGSPQVMTPGSPPGPPVSSGGGGGSIVAQPAPYSVVVSPNPRFRTAVQAITPTNQISSDKEAVGLAKAARENLQKSGKWTNTQIVVFSNRQSASAFQQYMNDRRGAPLDKDNYAELAQQNAWTGAAAYYTSTGNSEHVYYPSQNPKGWWPNN